MTVVSDAEVLWDRVCALLEEQVSDGVFQASFRGTSGLYLDENCLTVIVPSRFVQERIDQRYRGLVHSALTDAGHPTLTLELRVAPDDPATNSADDLNESLGSMTDEAIGTDTTHTIDLTAQRQQSTNLNARYTFDSFVTGPSNRFASAAALSVAERPALSYNPLFVYGAAGLGKTHLLQAIAHYVGENYPTYTVRYISTETLLNDFIDAIRNNTQAEFKRRYREIDVLLVDDVQFMEGKEQLQEEFFHTFNTLHEANRQIVLSSDRPPDAVATLEDRLRSRFKMGLVTDIQPPDLETRLAILRVKAAQSATPVPSEVLEFIVTHVTNNIRELEGALNRVTAYAALTGTDLQVADAENVLDDIIVRSQPRQITPEIILDTTATKFGFAVADLQRHDRRRPLVLARHICMYLFRELTDLSYPQIAEHFDGRDHTTIIYGYEKIKTVMKERKNVYDSVTELIQEIKAG